MAAKLVLVMMMLLAGVNLICCSAINIQTSKDEGSSSSQPLQGSSHSTEDHTVKFQERTPPSRSTSYYNTRQYPNGYAKLSLQWIPSACKAMNCRQMRGRFALRGFWRELDNRQSSNSMNEKAELPDDVLNDFKSPLVDHWPEMSKSYGAFSAMKGFWRMNYDMHGKYFSTFTPYGFVRRAVSLTEKYYMDLYEQLELAGISPEEHPIRYNPEKISQVMKYYIGHKVEIHCVNGTEDGRNYFAEIRICFDDGGFEMIDCPIRFSKCDFHGVYFAPLP